MKLDRVKIYNEYMKRIKEISDDLPDKSNFMPLEIVDILCDVIEDNEEAK